MSADEVADLVAGLEDEVNNGGFHQFFHNSTGKYTNETISALEVIGAKATASILKRAASRFPGEMPPQDEETRRDVLWESFPLTNEFNDLNNEFFAYPDDLSALIAKFKANPHRH